MREKILPVFAHVLVRNLWVAVCLALLPSHGLAADAFYRGKSIVFIIGSAPGGGYDTYSRLLANHIGEHLEGRPRVIPQNMPGGGSIRAANYLYNSAPKDGTAIGMLDEAIYLNQILGTPDLKGGRGEIQLDRPHAREQRRLVRAERGSR